MTAQRFASDPDGLPGVVRVGDLVFVGGCVAADAGGRTIAPGDPVRQTALALDILEQRLAAAGASLAGVVGILSFHTDARQIADAFEAARPRLAGVPPAWTPVAVTGLAPLGAVVALSAIAHVGGDERRCVTPDTIAWWRTLPASAGCRKGDLAVVAGQYGSDADGNVNTPGDHGGQARNALNRLAEVMRLLGGDLDDVVEILSVHQDPRGIALGQAVAATEFFPGGALPVWTPAGSPALYGFGMLGQYQAIGWLSPAGGASLVATSAEAAQPQVAWEHVERRLADAGANPADIVAVTAFQKDVRDADAARAVVRARCSPAWMSGAMTGFAELGAMHAFRALATIDRG